MNLSCRSRRRAPFFIWECKGTLYFLICKLFFKDFQIFISASLITDLPPYIWQNTPSSDDDRVSYKKVAATYSPTWWGSTIGDGELNFSVRNGKRWILTAITATVCFWEKIIRTTSLCNSRPESLAVAYALSLLFLGLSSLLCLACQWTFHCSISTGHTQRKMSGY